MTQELVDTGVFLPAIAKPGEGGRERRREGNLPSACLEDMPLPSTAHHLPSAVLKSSSLRVLDGVANDKA